MLDVTPVGGFLSDRSVSPMTTNHASYLTPIRDTFKLAEFKVFIKWEDGTFEANLPSKPTVVDLRRAVKGHSMALRSVDLVFNGRVLEDDGRALSEYGIQESSIIDAVPS
jgi:hypothetical protein